MSRTKTFPIPNPFIESLEPYKPVTSREIALKDSERKVLKLDWNESTRPPSPEVTKSILAQLSRNHMNLYPDITARELRDKLSKYTGQSPDHILVTNGSDDALKLIINTYVKPGGKVIVPVPTYSHFLVFAQAQGGDILEIEYDDPFVVQWEKLFETTSLNPELYYLPSPSNPTGILYLFPQVARLAELAPQSIILVDEAYFEFSQKSVVELVNSWPNIVVTRTFSKAFGMAGLRIGYVIGHPHVIEDLSRLHNPKSVNTISQAAAIGALKDIEYTMRYVESVNEAKEFLLKELDKLGVEAKGTPANYVMIKVPRASEVVQALAKRKCFVRDRSSLPGLKDWFRVTVGPKEDMEEFLARFKDVLRELNSQITDSAKNPL